MISLSLGRGLGEGLTVRSTLPLAPSQREGKKKCLGRNRVSLHFNLDSPQRKFSHEYNLKSAHESSQDKLDYSFVRNSSSCISLLLVLGGHQSRCGGHLLRFT